jgi:hypothetical protein
VNGLVAAKSRLEQGSFLFHRISISLCFAARLLC